CSTSSRAWSSRLFLAFWRSPIGSQPVRVEDFLVGLELFRFGELLDLLLGELSKEFVEEPQDGLHLVLKRGEPGVLLLDPVLLLRDLLHLLLELGDAELQVARLRVGGLDRDLAGPSSHVRGLLLERRDAGLQGLLAVPELGLLELEDVAVDPFHLPDPLLDLDDLLPLDEDLRDLALQLLALADLDRVVGALEHADPASRPRHERVHLLDPLLAILEDLLERVGELPQGGVRDPRRGRAPRLGPWFGLPVPAVRIIHQLCEVTLLGGLALRRGDLPPAAVA